MRQKQAGWGQGTSTNEGQEGSRWVQISSHCQGQSVEKKKEMEWIPNWKKRPKDCTVDESGGGATHCGGPGLVWLAGGVCLVWSVVRREIGISLWGNRFNWEGHSKEQADNGVQLLRWRGKEPCTIVKISPQCELHSAAKIANGPHSFPGGWRGVLACVWSGVSTWEKRHVRKNNDKTGSPS